MMTKVVCAVILKNNKVMVALRGKNMQHAGSWELPGGKVNQDESEQVALQRELKEEFNIDIIVDDLFCSNIHEYKHIKIELIAYWCRLISEKITPVEHDEIRWVDGNQLLSLKWTEADIPIIEQLIFNLKNSSLII
jgi:8-oxo-dGTP diphosphatase